MEFNEAETFDVNQGETHQDAANETFLLLLSGNDEQMNEEILTNAFRLSSALPLRRVDVSEQVFDECQSVERIFISSRLV